MSRILILRFSSLGDMVLLSALVETAHDRDPDDELWLVTKEQYADLYRADPRLSGLITLRDGASLFSLRDAIDRVGFDLLLDAHGSLRSRALGALLRPGPVRRIAKDSLARLLFLHARIRTPGLSRRLVDRYLELLDPPFEARPARLELDALAHEEAATSMSDLFTWLALAPGARHATKRWPLERFTALARRIEESNLGRILLVGGPGEEELCEDIGAQLRERPMIRAGNLRLDRLGAMLARCAAVVGNDSGVLHLAEAVGTGVIALFGPTSQEWGYFPQRPESQVLEQELPCRPCSRNGERRCRMPERWCLTRTDVEPVFEELERLLEKRLTRQLAQQPRKPPEEHLEQEQES